MPTLREVARAVRSKAAGPFWVTIDIFFATDAHYRAYARSPTLGADTVAQLYGVAAEHVRSFPVDRLRVLKITYPRPTPQAWVEERDLHSGQQYVRLLGLDLDAAN